MRAVLAVVAGVVLWGVLWVGAGTGLAAAMPGSFDAEGFIQSDGIHVSMIGISVVISMLVGYVCAAIARKSPMRVVWILAVIQLAIGIGVQAAVWEKSPLWFHLPFLALVVPAHVAGGWLRVGRRMAVSVG